MFSKLNFKHGHERGRLGGPRRGRRRRPRRGRPCYTGAPRTYRGRGRGASMEDRAAVERAQRTQHDVRVHGGGLSFSPFSTAFASGGGLGPGKPRGVLCMFPPARSDGSRRSSATDAPSEKKIVTSSGGRRWGRASHRWKAEVSAIQPDQSDRPKV